MADFSSNELGLLKAFLSGGSLPTKSQNDVVDTLQKKAPDFFTQFTADLSKAKLGNKSEVFKHLTKNLNKINIALKKTKYFSTPQQTDLINASEKPLAKEGVVYPQGGEVPVEQAPTGGTSGGSGGGIPGMGAMPQGGSSIRTLSRPSVIVHEAKQTEPPGTVTAESAKTEVPQAFQKAFENGPDLDPTQKPSPGVAAKSGNVVKTYNIQAPSRLSAIRNKIGAGIERANPFLKRAGNNLVNGLTNIVNPRGMMGGAGTGSRSIFGRIGGIGKRGAGRGTSIVANAKKRGGVAFALGIIGFMALVGMLALSGASSQPGGTTTGSIPPGTISSYFGLDYTLPLKNPAVQLIDIRDKIKADFPGSKIEYWDTIVQRSKNEGWNPAMVLALWIEETGASQATLIKNGGSEILTNGALSKGHLGCATAEDQTIDESLNCFFNFVAANNFADNQFPQLMAKYSGGPPNDPFSNNPNFLAAYKNWYSQLVPAGTGAIQTITSTSGGGSGIISCPLIGGYITTGSKDAPGGQGHCSADYQKQYPCANPDVTGRATAVDLESSSKNVYLPYVNNERVTWRIVEPNTAINENEGGGVAVAADTASQGKTYTIRFVHLASSNLKVNDTLSSTDPIGQYLTHLHVTLQENGDFKPGDLYFNLCK